MKTNRRIAVCLFAWLSSSGVPLAQAFWIPFQKYHGFSHKSSSTALNIGHGIANTYSWKEDAYEIEITVKVPINTRARDILFQAKPQSIDLRLSGSNTTILDGARKLRGRINLDGTYWVISDSEDNRLQHREVTVTIEKLLRTPKDDFEVLDTEWKGVYAKEDDDEVIHRKYEEPEELDIREYAASMGVDIDNINMSMVDKTMFTSELNMTHSTLDELHKSGYLSPNEITQQADGTEYTTDDNGEPIPYEDFLKNKKVEPIPFIDTSSPWHKTTATVLNGSKNKTVVQQVRNFTRAAFAEESAKQKEQQQQQQRESKQKKISRDAKDPIDTLTVERLKEILREQGLPVSGNKKELQTRLRNRVNALLQGKQEDQG
jgi:hypothetical protein